MSSEEFFCIVGAFVIACMGFCIGIIVGSQIEIQEIKPVESGYYITINDEIYYKENSNE